MVAIAPLVGGHRCLHFVDVFATAFPSNFAADLARNRLTHERSFQGGLRLHSSWWRALLRSGDVAKAGT